MPSEFAPGATQLGRDSNYLPNPLAPSFEVIANTSGVTGISLNATLHSVHENMPNFVLSRTDRTIVIAYILSLKNEREGMIR